MLCVLYTDRAPCQKYCPKIAYPRSVLPSDCLIKCKRAVCRVDYHIIRKSLVYVYFTDVKKKQILTAQGS